MIRSSRLLAERTLLADAVFVGFPAPARHPYKRLLRQLANPDGSAGSGSLHVSRWAEGLDPVVPTTPVETEVRVRAEGFVYEPPGTGEVHWHVNFADADVFGFHAGALFAQDEMQIAEHPILASVRDWMLDEHFPALTEEDGRATPILVSGAERRLSVDTAPRPGAPHGLYGHRFAAAPWAVVREATTVLQPPTVSNIAAMAAPQGGYGRYSRDEITHVLATAVTTFSAARVVSQHLHGEGVRVVMHSGFWGCGAFGGNRQLMPALQMLAARRAGLDRLDMHSLGVGGPEAMQHAMQVAQEIGAGDDVRAWIAAAYARGFEWGESDGN